MLGVAKYKVGDIIRHIEVGTSNMIIGIKPVEAGVMYKIGDANGADTNEFSEYSSSFIEDTDIFELVSKVRRQDKGW